MSGNQSKRCCCGPGHGDGHEDLLLRAGFEVEPGERWGQRSLDTAGELLICYGQVAYTRQQSQAWSQMRPGEMDWVMVTDGWH